MFVHHFVLGIDFSIIASFRIGFSTACAALTPCQVEEACLLPGGACDSAHFRGRQNRLAACLSVGFKGRTDLVKGSEPRGLQKTTVPPRSDEQSRNRQDGAH